MSGGPFQSVKKSAVPWPTAGQYNEAVQNLRVSMSDPELRGGGVALERRSRTSAQGQSAGGSASGRRVVEARTGRTVR